MHQICHTHPGITKIQSVDTPTSSSTSPTTSARAACSPPKDDNNATNACSSDCSSVCESFYTGSVNADKPKTIGGYLVTDGRGRRA